VPACLSASCSASPASTSVGQTVTWTATPTGGSGTTTYSWTGANLAGKNTQIATTSYATVGAYYASTTVSDGASTTTIGCPAVTISALSMVPPILSATALPCGGFISFSWNAVAGATSYKIFKNGGVTQIWQSTGATTSQTLPVSVTGASSGDFTIKAVIDSVDSNASNIVSATPSAPCVCSAPLTDTQTINCDIEYLGSITQSRTKAAYPDCTSWGSWITDSSTCTLKPHSSSLDCSLTPASSTVNIYAIATWTASTTSPCPACTKVWTFTDTNYPQGKTITVNDPKSYTLSTSFSTEPPKTIGLTVYSDTHRGNECFATTTMVSNNESTQER
jgi:hypothetical protein